jgi:hypothetical protein
VVVVAATRPSPASVVATSGESAVPAPRATGARDVLSVDFPEEEIRNILRSWKPLAGEGVEVRSTASGSIISVSEEVHDILYALNVCPFGRIVHWVEGVGDLAESKTGILGGLIQCGDQNWNMEDDELNLDIDGVWLISLEIDCEVNRDDDGELLLPGVKTGTKPTTWTHTAWSEGTDYPDNVAPAASDGLGIIDAKLIFQ